MTTSTDGDPTTNPIEKGVRVRITTGPLKGSEGVAYDVSTDGVSVIPDKAIAEIMRLDARVDELQARGTELENERRMWRARAEAAREILTALVVDAPILQRLMGHGVTGPDVQDLLSSGLAAHARIELLEQDAWTACSAIAREFVREMDGMKGNDPDAVQGRAFDYADRFRGVLAR